MPHGVDGATAAHRSGHFDGVAENAHEGGEVAIDLHHVAQHPGGEAGGQPAGDFVAGHARTHQDGPGGAGRKHGQRVGGGQHDPLSGIGPDGGDNGVRTQGGQLEHQWFVGACRTNNHSRHGFEHLCGGNEFPGDGEYLVAIIFDQNICGRHNVGFS